MYLFGASNLHSEIDGLHLKQSYLGKLDSKTRTKGLCFMIASSELGNFQSTITSKLLNLNN